jgi:hypothetical protein
MKQEDKQPLREVRSLEGWRGDELELSLGEEDLDLVDNVLCLAPELRIVVRLGQEARQRVVTYPVTSLKSLVRQLQGDSFELDGHRVDAASIRHAMAEDWFPLEHEGELLSAIHLAIRRCQAELAAETLDNLRSHSRTERRESEEHGNGGSL